MLEGITDAIRLIQETTRQAEGAKDKVILKPAPELGMGRVLMVTHTASGPVTEILQAQARRYHELGTVGTVPAWVKYAVERLQAPCTVWVYPDKINVVLHDESNDAPWDGAFVVIDTSDEYDSLTAWEEKPSPLGQKDFIRLLRTKLWDALPVNSRDRLIQSLRVIQFENSESGRLQVVGNGRESLGMEINRSVVSEYDALPDEIELQVRVFSDPDLVVRKPVRVELEVDPRKCQFALTPHAGQLSGALNSSIEDIINQLRGTCPPETPIFWGSPG